MDVVPVPGGLRPVRRQVRQQQRLVRDLGRAGGVQEQPRVHGHILHQGSFHILRSCKKISEYYII